MAKRCGECKKFLPKDWHHRLCRRCRKLEKAGKIVMKQWEEAKQEEPKIESQPEVYLGKKAECGYCGEVTHLYSTRRSSKKVCEDCKKWLEGLKFLEAIAV